MSHLDKASAALQDGRDCAGFTARSGAGVGNALIDPVQLHPAALRTRGDHQLQRPDSSSCSEPAEVYLQQCISSLKALRTLKAVKFLGRLKQQQGGCTPGTEGSPALHPQPLPCVLCRGHPCPTLFPPCVGMCCLSDPLLCSPSAMCTPCSGWGRGGHQRPRLEPAHGLERFVSCCAHLAILCTSARGFVLVFSLPRQRVCVSAPGPRVCPRQLDVPLSLRDVVAAGAGMEEQGVPHTFSLQESCPFRGVGSPWDKQVRTLLPRMNCKSTSCPSLSPGLWLRTRLPPCVGKRREGQPRTICDLGAALTRAQGKRG